MNEIVNECCFDFSLINLIYMNLMLLYHNICRFQIDSLFANLYPSKARISKV